jgi:hypothetical protein
MERSREPIKNPVFAVNEARPSNAFLRRLRREKPSAFWTPRRFAWREALQAFPPRSLASWLPSAPETLFLLRHVCEAHALPALCREQIGRELAGSLALELASPERHSAPLPTSAT